MNIKQKLVQIVKESLGKTVELSEPKDPKLGDYSTSIAFTLAKEKSPKDLATKLVSKIKVDPKFVERIEIGGAGFINFWLNRDFIYNFLFGILKEGTKFGSSSIGAGKRVLVEFVSANPTGPLNVANGRAAAIGGSIVRILNFTGYEVDSEYYVDDYGRQIDLLEESIKARYQELEGEKVKFPEDGYKGKYIKDIARELRISKSREFRKYGIQRIVDSQHNTLKRFGVEFGNWVYESAIRKSGSPQRVIEKIKKLTYKKDGALWLKTTKFGDEKDKVLIKSSGEFTYVVPDIAYHLNKFDRGYEWLIDLLGPDHLAHIPELKTGISICNYPQDKLKVLIVQWVTLLKGKEKIGMSKRKGEFVTLDELIDEVGRDVARFFFLTRKCESHLDFDIELAKRESKENPVYYIQYACARISSILRFAETQGIKTKFPNLSLLSRQEELLLMRKLIHFPEIVELASTELTPHYISFYLIELAALFHNFYEKHKVVSDDSELTQARLILVSAVRQVISNALSLIGIKAPEKM
ncbi:arginine--tRNA ligase [candidate division WOR-3 bacterium]|nr:arginine--tRNA ligase [candidate division WOR-3 bacterium]